jgi:hypothetical protein
MKAFTVISSILPPRSIEHSQQLNRLRQVCFVSVLMTISFFLRRQHQSRVSLWQNLFHAARQPSMILTMLSPHYGAGAAIRDAAAYGRRDREGFVMN